jgi:hypothetical protein
MAKPIVFRAGEKLRLVDDIISLARFMMLTDYLSSVRINIVGRDVDFPDL